MIPQPVAYSNVYIVVVARCLDLLVAGWIWRQYGVTISSFTGLAMHRAAPPSWAKILNGFLNFFEKNHCELAIICDLERAALATAILQGRTPI